MNKFLTKTGNLSKNLIFKYSFKLNLSFCYQKEINYTLPKYFSFKILICSYVNTAWYQICVEPARPASKNKIG